MRHHENKRTFSCFCILTARLLTYTGITAFVLIIITRLMNDENSYVTRYVSTEKEKLRAVYPNLRSGPILAVLIHSPCPLECYFQSETNIEPDLRLSLSRVSHMGSLCQPKERDRSFS